MRAKTLTIALCLGAFALGTAACFDFDLAYSNCGASGRCSGDAGPADGGGTDAGPVDAGPPDAGPYDGGPPCSGSTSPRLRCDAPIDLGTGTGITGAALSATDAGFIAGWVGATVELREVHLDGTSRTLVTGVPITQGQLVVDGRGARWAAAWASNGAGTATCLTDSSDAGVTVSLRDGGTIAVLNIATSPAGAVGVTAVTGTDRFLGTYGPTGCPTELPPLLSTGVNSGGLAFTSAPGGGGFRYVWTQQINLYNGSLHIMSREADGGTASALVPLSLRAPSGVAVLASTSGAAVVTAYMAFNSTDKYEVGVWGTSADVSGDGAPVIAAGPEPGWWNIGTCGEGCMVTGVLGYDVPGPAVINFFGDDSNLASRGTWDALCAQPATAVSGASISVAGFGGRLGVLLTSATTARLYLCDVPPLR